VRCATLGFGIQRLRRNWVVAGEKRASTAYPWVSEFNAYGVIAWSVT